MIEMIHSIFRAIDIEIVEPIEKNLTYYHIEGCKYITLMDKDITEEEIERILDSIGRDGKTYPFNSDYLVIVAAETSGSFKSEDLYFMRDAGEHVVFILRNKMTNQIFYPTSFVFPPRFSYRKILKRIAETIINKQS